MDDEAKQLLREMRDMMAAGAVSDAKWKDEIRANLIRQQKNSRVFYSIVGFTIGLGMITWGILSALNSLPTAKPDKNTITLPDLVPHSGRQ